MIDKDALQQKAEDIEHELGALRVLEQCQMTEFVNRLEAFEGLMPRLAGAVIEACAMMADGAEGDPVEACRQSEILPDELADGIKKQIGFIQDELPKVQAAEVIEVHGRLPEMVRTFGQFVTICHKYTA